MSDHISRQAAIDAVRKCQVKEVTPAYMLIDKADVMTELMMLPSAQPESKREWYQKGYKAGYKDGSPEIIRCKDCEYIRIGGVDDGAHWYYCDQTDCDTEWDGYCHRAERRTDEQVD